MMEALVHHYTADEAFDLAQHYEGIASAIWMRGDPAQPMALREVDYWLAEAVRLENEE